MRQAAIVPLLVVAILQAEASAAPAPSPAPLVLTPPPPAPEMPPLRRAAFEYAAGAGAALVVVPATLYLGTWLGSISSDTVGALLPPLLLMLTLPPVAVTLAEWLVARRIDPRGARFHPAVWAAVGLNTLGVVFGALGGVWVGDPLAFSLFTLAEALVLPVGVTLVMHYKRPRPVAPSPPAAPTLPEPPRATGAALPTLSVPVARFSF